jgi:hypothetical protein
LFHERFSTLLSMLIIQVIHSKHVAPAIVETGSGDFLRTCCDVDQADGCLYL